MHNTEFDNSQDAEKKELQALLQRIRQQSVEASRRGDIRTVARLTMEAARINARCSVESPAPRRAPSLLALI